MGPGVKAVADRIRADIKAGRLQPGTFLPTRIELARSLGVGTNTVMSAMTLLKKENVLVGVRGQRTRTMPSTPVPWYQSPTPPTKQTLIEQIKDDIMSGVYKPDASLPTIKELQVRYDASYVTIKKALLKLMHQDLLIQRGRKFAIPRLSTYHSPGHILFLGYSDKPFLPTYDHDTLLIRILERECFRNAIAFEKRIIFDHEDQVILWQHGNPTALPAQLSSDCLGIVYFASWPGAINPKILDWLGQVRMPVSIVDWLGGWVLPEKLQRRTDVQMQMSSVGAKPGYDVGQYLIRQGNRSIAYFSPYALQWPAIRFQGMVDAYALGGSEYRVHGFFQNQITSETEFEDRMRKRHHNLGGIFSKPFGISENYTAAITHLESQAWIASTNAVRFDILQPLFEEAFANTSITAWVGCDDATALMAWSFLTSKGAKIPGQISLLGFGNTINTTLADVSSYDFDFEATVSTILNFILQIRYIKRFNRLLRPEIRGHIVSRGSTRKV